MATDDAIVGVDLKVQKDGTLIGMQTDASLQVSPDMKEIIVKNTPGGGPTDWKARLPGKQEWSMDHENLVLDQSDEKGIADPNATLKMEVDTTDDSTDNPTLVEVPLLDSIDFQLTQELAEIGGLDQPLWRYLRAAEREFMVELSGTLVEPTSDGGAVYKELEEARDNRVALPFELDVFGKTFSGDTWIGDVSRQASTGGEDATIDMTLQSELGLTTNGSFGSSVDPIFTAFMNKDTVDMGMLHYAGQSPETGTRKLSGTGYYSEISISLESGEPISMSGTVEGDGPLALGTVA